MKGSTILFVALSAILGFLAIVPLYYLVCGSFSKALGHCAPPFTLQNYISGFSSPILASTYLNTVVFSVGSAAVGTVIAIFVAWIVTRTNTPFRRLFEFIGLVPNFFQLVLVGISWTFLLYPVSGLVNVWTE